MAASPNEVGRIHIRVVPDLKGFREKVEAEAKRTAKSASGNTVRFKSKVESAKGEAKRAASEASGNTVRFDAKLDKKRLKQEAGIAAIAASGQNIKFGIDIDRRGLKGLFRSISTGFNAVDIANTSDVIGRTQAQIAALYRGLERVRRSSVSMILTVMKGFNGFGRPLKYAYSAVQKLGKGMASIWDRSELLGLYRQDLVDYFEHLGGKARKSLTGIKTRATSALGSVQGQLRKIGESDAWLKMGRAAEKAAQHVRNINVRPVIPIKGRYSDAQIRVMQMRVDLDATKATTQLNNLSQNRTTTLKVNTDGVDKATSRFTRLKRTVDRTAQAHSLIGDSILLRGAYGGLKAWAGIRRVIGLVAKVGAIAGIAISALMPPLVALGGVVGMAALGAVGGIAAGLAVVGNLGLGALFVGMAARSQEVKDAWSATGKSMAKTFDAANKPVEGALISLAPKVATAFERMAPNIGRVSQGVAELLDQFGTSLPMLADSTGKAMEQIFEAGRPGMEKLINRLPAIVSGLGNMFQVIGESKAIQRIWNGFMDGLPGMLVSLGHGFDNAASAAGKLYDWFKSPGLEGFRTGLSDFWNELKNVDWTQAREGIEDMLNSMGKIAGDTDVQGLVDGIGNISSAISGLLDAFNALGLEGSIGVSILGGILAGIARELAAAAISFGAKKLMEKLFGTTADIAGEAVDIGVGVAGGLLDGLLSGLVEGIAGGIGKRIGEELFNLFSGDDKQKVDIEIKSIKWPDGLSGPSGPYLITKYLLPFGPGVEPTGAFKISDILWPGEDAEGLSGKFDITEVIWPGDLENLTGSFEITKVIWPGDLENLTGTFEITNVVLPEGLSDLTENLTLLIAPLEQVNALFQQLSASGTLLNNILLQVSTSLPLVSAAGMMLAATGMQLAMAIQMVNTGLTTLQTLLPTLPPSVTLFMTSLMLLGTALTLAATFVMTLFTSLSNLYNTLANLIPTGVQTFISALGQIPGAISGFVTSLFNTGGGFSFFDGGLLGNIGSIGDFINANGGIMGALGSLVGKFTGTGAGFSFFDGGLMGNIGSIDGFNGALGTVGGAIADMVSAVVSGVSEVVSAVASLPGSALGALGNLGGLLVGSGQSLVQGFVNGILSMVGAVRSAAASVAAAARGFFPFSPAKEGPFSGKGYTTYSGRALVKDFAGGMLDERGSVRDAAATVVSDVKRGIEDYQKNLDRMHDVNLTQPIMESNAKKIHDFRKREAEAHEKGNADLGKLAEDRQKMLDSLEHPDFREINASFRAYYIDGTKEMMQKGLLQQARDVGFSNQIRYAAQDAIAAVRAELGDHPILAGVEANVNADHFEWAVQKAIEESGIAYIPIELGIANLEQFKSDLGFGDGVISRGIAAALDYNPNESDAYRFEKEPKEEVHYHVSDMEEAIRLENERRSRQSLRFY